MNKRSNSLLDEYMQHTAGTESPKTFHRWCFLSIVSAELARNVYIPFGHGRIYPNMYVMLMGVPAARKSTAVNIAKKLLAASKYKNFAFTKTSREKFLMDFEYGFSVSQTLDKGALAALIKQETTVEDKLALLEQAVVDQEPVSEAFICCDEFVDFIGQKNINFINTLTTLWDCLDNYPERLKNSISVNVVKPTVGLLGGITPTSFSTAMPQEVVGQGFMSRIILVYGEPSKIKITWPVPPDEKNAKLLAEKLQKVRKLRGQCKISAPANKLIDEIYQNYHNIPDARLQYYCARRLDHLLKLCMVIAATKLTTVIEYDTVEEANTILVYTENSMSRALGEFGEAKHSKATQKIVEALSQAEGPMETTQLWQIVSQDLDRVTDLQNILGNLSIANKIVQTGSHIMINRNPNTKNTIGVNYEKYIIEAGSIDSDGLI